METFDTNSADVGCCTATELPPLTVYVTFKSESTTVMMTKVVSAAITQVQKSPR